MVENYVEIMCQSTMQVTNQTHIISTWFSTTNPTPPSIIILFYWRSKNARRGGRMDEMVVMTKG